MLSHPWQSAQESAGSTCLHPFSSPHAPLTTQCGLTCTSPHAPLATWRSRCYLEVFSFCFGFASLLDATLLLLNRAVLQREEVRGFLKRPVSAAGTAPFAAPLIGFAPSRFARPDLHERTLTGNVPDA